MYLQISCSSSTVNSRRCTGWSACWFSPSDEAGGSRLSWKIKTDQMVNTALGTHHIVLGSIPTSFSCFVIPFNLKKLSLSLKDGLFLMELEAAAGGGQGIGFSGEVEGNLEEDVNSQICVDLFLWNCEAVLTCRAHCCPQDPLFPNDPSHLRWHDF